MFLTIFGCSKKNDLVRTSDMSVPQITGFQIRNEVGSITKIVGLPNIKLNDDQLNYKFTFFPNPTKDIGMLYIYTPKSNVAKQIWVVQAQYDNFAEDFRIGNGMIINFIGGTPLFNLETTSENVALNLKDLYNGYYRVYVQIGDVLLYDNIIIYK